LIKRLIKVLGHGYFGTVHLGEDSIHGEVAVKVLKKRVDQTEEEWSELQLNLLKEGQNLVKAKHTNVVQVHYIEPAEGGVLRLVMEHCAGGSIAKHYERGPLTLAHTREVATSVAMGLEAVHARGMLHRDVKPANILIAKDGVTKLGDFGLITDKIAYGYGSIPDRKYAPHVAKEIWDGAGTSIRTDVWALGMTIYRLLHGEDWYEDFILDFTRIQKGGFAKKLLWMPHVPRAWRTFIRKCLNDDTARRFQSAGAVLSGLAKLPVAPEWRCDYQDHEVSWSAVEGNRRIAVRWLRPDNDPHRWDATSYPIGSGIKRALGGSESLSELDAFFEHRAR
jgi:serine/threonine protein kinase